MPIVRSVGSLWFAALLMLLLLVAMATATLYETAHGSEQALLVFYHSGWFAALGALLAVNVAAAVAARYPFSRKQIGFVLTHTSILVVLAGAMVTRLWGVEGRVALLPGQSTIHFQTLRETLSMTRVADVPLGCTLKLERFRIGHYPGTDRPRSFESHVSITDSYGAVQSRIISMNHPATFCGYTFYQSSYYAQDDQIASVLSVSRDPGRPIVFAGYIALLLGMLIVVAGRVKAGLPAAACGIVLLAAWPLRAEAASPVSIDPEVIRGLTVQHDGRWMPLDTLARDVVETVTGETLYRGRDPVLWLLEWTFTPRQWLKQPVIRIAQAELRAELQLPTDREVFSYYELIHHRPLLEMIGAAAGSADGRPANPLEAKELEIKQKLLWLHRLFSGQAIRIIPDPSDSLGEWRTIGPSTEETSEEMRPVRSIWDELGSAFGADDGQAFADAAQRLKASLDQLPAAYRPAPDLIAVELRYNRLQPFRMAGLIAALGAVVAAAAWWIRRRWFDGLVVAVLLGGFVMLTYGLLLRWRIAGRIPAANMYESLLFLSWGAALTALVSTFITWRRLILLTASALSAAALLLADLLPLDAYIRPIPPVLLDTVWMSIHVPIIMAAYAVLALAAVLAHGQVLAFAFGRGKLTGAAGGLHYWYLLIGSWLLLAGIVTGSIWAASSWGRYWGWDSKEVWSLIAFLGYLALLHVRIAQESVPLWARGAGGVLLAAVFALLAVKLAPWTAGELFALGGAAGAVILFLAGRGPFAVAVKSIVAFWLIIMTYVGVNYVLGIGLHSYGFGAAAVVRYLLAIGGVDLLLVAVCSVLYYAGRGLMGNARG